MEPIKCRFIQMDALLMGIQIKTEQNNAITF